MYRQVLLAVRPNLFRGWRQQTGVVQFASVVICKTQERANVLLVESASWIGNAISRLKDCIMGVSLVRCLHVRCVEHAVQMDTLPAGGAQSALLVDLIFS
jgi:hypothetical protein